MPKKSAQKSEYSSVGRTFACQAKGREFEPLHSLQYYEKEIYFLLNHDLSYPWWNNWKDSCIYLFVIWIK